jgi:DNA-binding transcriptional MerR regulator
MTAGTGWQDPEWRRWRVESIRRSLAMLNEGQLAGLTRDDAEASSVDPRPGPAATATGLGGRPGNCSQARMSTLRYSSVVAAPVQSFTTDQVLRITGVTRRRLSYWLDRGIITADVDEARGRGHVRLWSFRNLVEVRVALWLRDRVSLQLIGRIVLQLRSTGLDTPLASMRFAIVDGTGRKRRADDVVIWTDDGSLELPVSGQVVFHGTLPLREWSEELQRAAESDRRARRRVGEFEQRRGRLGSAVVFAGTRVPVDAVRHLLAAGWSEKRILDNYPGLTPADLRATHTEVG